MEQSTDTSTRTGMDASDGPGVPAAALDQAPDHTPDAAPAPEASAVPPAPVNPELPLPAALSAPVDPPVEDAAAPVPPAAPSVATQRFTLRRSRTDKMLGGVCGGVAQSLEVDAALLRIGMVVLTVLGFGLGAVLYVAAWILAPVDDAA